MEDYKAVFMIMFETWGAAVGSSFTCATYQNLLDIAIILRCLGAIVADRRHRTWRYRAPERSHSFTQASAQDQAIVLSRHID